MASKKKLSALFRAIRTGNATEVVESIRAEPELVNACSSGPPKRDDGQSPLQVALKGGNFAIAEFLIEQGADVNFIEDGDNAEQTSESERTRFLRKLTSRARTARRKATGRL